MHKGGGADLVRDFNFADGDRIQLDTGTAYTVGAAHGDVLITLASGDSIELAGVAPGSFSADWIVFA